LEGGQNRLDFVGFDQFNALLGSGSGREHAGERHSLMRLFTTLLIIAISAAATVWLHHKNWVKLPTTALQTEGHTAPLIGGAPAEPSEIEVTGSLRAADEVAVKADALCRVKRLYVHAGDEVKVGDLLVEVDELIGLEAYDKLAAQISPKGTLDTSDLKHFDEIRAGTKIRSRIDGTVIMVRVAEGQIVSGPAADGQGGTLLVVGDVSKLIVATHVKQEYAAKLRVNKVVQVRAKESPQEKMNAMITSIAPVSTVQNSIKGFSLLALIENPAPGLAPGMTVEVRIPSQR
jgi:multidrug efflux pump subunit AcrA (membrane-fusion protein)